MAAKPGGLQGQGDQGRSRSKLLRAIGNAGSGVLKAFATSGLFDTDLAHLQ
jgi:hypothetical protein